LAIGLGKRITVAIVLFGIIYAGILITLLSAAKLVEKQNLKADISTSISNGADVAVVKQIYENRKALTRIFSLTKLQGEYYNYDVPLSKILQDIRVDYFLTGKKDEEFIIGLEKIISEYLQIDPFDKLESSQRDYFENIRLKSKDTYVMIRNDLDKIADELYKKNLLASKYLNKAETSFWISILGLVFALLIGVATLVQNRKKRLQDIISDEIDRSKQKNKM
jgi:hypothetical protein